MDTKINRFFTALVLSAGLLPLLTFAFVYSNEKIEAEKAFRTALEEAQAEYQRTRGLPALARRYEAELKDAQERLPSLMRGKYSIRREIAAVTQALADLERRYGWEANTAMPAAQDIADALRTAQRAPSFLASDAVGASFFRRLLIASFGDVLDEDVRSGMVGNVLFARIETEDLRRRLQVLKEQHETLRVQTLALTDQEERAATGLKVTQEQLKNIAATVEEVHAEVLKMQGALARIDARIKSRIERELLEKGLLTPGAIDHAGRAGAPQFAWPALGALSAGFLDASYQEYFGIPHRGLDIVIGQGTPVFSAADGVVFLARDGGKSGYSFVLIGHRGGYATLYGHLSRITVTSGQDIRQGEAVGLSGGAVGAHGSGPTTTGPHLHFEVIRDGTNINPKSALP